MHWTYEDLMALPADIYDELVLWVRDARGAGADVPDAFHDDVTPDE